MISVRLRTVLLFALLPMVTCAAENTTRPTSFVGVPWGSSPEDTLRILSARSGVAVPGENAITGDKVELTGGKFAGQAVVTWTLEFNARKLYVATVVLRPETTAQSVYRELKQMLNAKYGPASSERKPDTGTDAEKKARRERRRLTPDIKTFGNVATWKFGPVLNDKESKLIELELAGPDGGETMDESQLRLTVRYVNESLKPSATSAVPGNNKAEPPRPAVRVDDL